MLPEADIQQSDFDSYGHLLIYAYRPRTTRSLVQGAVGGES